MALNPLDFSDASREPASLELTPRVSVLERDLREMQKELSALHAAKAKSARPVDDSFPRLLRQLVEMTNQILPGDVRIESSVDEDYPETVRLVFHVIPKTKLVDANAVIDKELEWHRNARKIFPEATCYFALAID